MVNKKVTKISAKDAFGVPLCLGDKVVYRYGGTLLQTYIRKVHKKKVTLIAADGSNIKVKAKKVAFVGEAF